ncbi:hypothetical protein KPL37_16195 [Clostridium frigoris]|uniref:Transposase n=1 Tax=Clostridium frigoris TaxID=205327 RepID=A0ABS6BXD8_9CLOT|nr:hypothetical protein [Clostridium frigoris]MBU3161259.1 hypothetical protein [Clostridium frigoris]
MIIINKRQHYFKENQIQQFLKLFHKDYIPKTIFKKMMIEQKNIFDLKV